MAGAQINPELIQQLTNQKITEIPKSPTVSTLPGQYAKLINRHKNKIKRQFSENSFMIKCHTCGRRGKYDVGLMVFNDPKNKDAKKASKTQTTGYFRCKHCNDAGNWEMPTDFLLSPLAGLLQGDLVQDKYTIGENQLFDGSWHLYSTDAETHLLKKLREEPKNDFIWNRLGNLYFKGNRPELAACVFEHSLALNPEQTESHYSLGGYFFQIEDYENAAYHFKQMLITASDYQVMKAEDLRMILANGLQELFIIYIETDGKIPFLPSREEIEKAGKLKEMDKNSRTMDLEVFPEDIESFFPMAEMYMGEQRKKLPARLRTFKGAKPRKKKKKRHKKKR